MISTTESPITFQALKGNLSKRVEEAQKGLAILELAETLIQDSIDIQLIESITCKEEYRFVEYNGGYDYRFYEREN